MQYILDEASGLTPVEKMRAWNNGTRNENIKACGDQKLLLYYDIIITNHFDNVRSDIESELRRRNLGQYIKPKDKFAALIRDHIGECLPNKNSLTEYYSYIMQYTDIKDFKREVYLHNLSIIKATQAYFCLLLLDATEYANLFREWLQSSGVTKTALMPVFDAINTYSNLLTNVINEITEE